jgi:hypothetical protein
MKAFVLSAVMALLGVSPLRAADEPPRVGASTLVPHRTMGADDYQSFLGNWDETKQPVLCALIRTPKQWDAIFHPAAFGLGAKAPKKPFAPDAKIFEKEQLLVVARVVPALKEGEGDKVFQVERVSAIGDALTLVYRYREPKSGASSTVKNCLGVFVPQRDFKKAVFIENGKKAGELDLAAGQWSVPAPPD